MHNKADAQPPGTVTLKTVAGMGDFARGEWNSLHGTSRNESGSSYNPFISYDFLSILEESRTVGARTGWQPHHLRLEDETGRLTGAVAAYLKSHSQGEYVFDQGWADAFERAGGTYYPKLQASVPFTPATGPRLLCADDDDTVRATLALGLKTVTDRLGVSSSHVTFAQANDIAALSATGYLVRTDQQFHWRNDGYGSYDDFLATLASRKRKALRKERAAAVENGITIDRLTGKDLTESVWDDFFAFYMDTGSRKWGQPYLNRRFFSLIGDRMAEDVLLVMARRDGRYIAGAINFIGGDRLFGRNWGCIEDHPFLHFEVCYHQAIDFAIERKLSVVEAGAQGEHKLARGYMPVTTSSAHYIAHPGLRRAVADYLERERQDVSEIGAYLEQHSPFRKSEQ